MIPRDSRDDRPLLGRRSQSAQVTYDPMRRPSPPLGQQPLSGYRQPARPPPTGPIPPVPGLTRERKDAALSIPVGVRRARRMTADEVEVELARSAGERLNHDKDGETRSIRSLAVGGSSSRRAPSNTRSSSSSVVPRATAFPQRELPPDNVRPPRSPRSYALDPTNAYAWTPPISQPQPRRRRSSVSSFETMSAPTSSAMGVSSPGLGVPPLTTPQHSATEPSFSDADARQPARPTPVASSSTLQATPVDAPSIRSNRSGNSSRSLKQAGDASTSLPSPRPRRVVMPKQIKEPIVPWTSIETPVAKTSSLYCSLTPMHGHPPPLLKAHTSTLVGDKIYVIGGATSSRGGCFPGVATFDIHTMRWDQVRSVKGKNPPPIRAHTSTGIDHTIWVFGGGDEMTYSSDMYAYNTLTHTWTLPPLHPDSPRPVARRAHSAAFSPPHSIVVFGGGDGHAALNDTWIFDTVSLKWEEVISPVRPGEDSQLAADGEPARGPVPERRGYHSGHVVDGKLIVFGGGNGQKTFDAVEALDLKTKVWHTISPPTDLRSRRRAYHAATVIGNLLVIVGGHDSKSYATDILCFDLRRKKWTEKHLAGTLYPGRGYHSATAADGRVFVLGGSDEQTFLSDMWTIDLGASAGLAHLNPVMIHLDS